MEQMISGDDTARPPSCIGKVAFSIFKYFPYGGLQLDMMRIAREFVRRNIEVVIFCMIWDAPEPPPGISYREIKAHGLSNHRKARNFESDLIEALSTDNFIAHVAFNRLTPADWYFAADVPFVESVPRSFLEKMLPRYQTFSAMEKEVFSPENNTKIFCITRSQQADFQRLYQTPSERIFQLPPGINRSFMSALELRKKRNEFREEFGVSENETLLVQVSSAFRTKGVDRSIAALAALPENIRNSTKLLVIGRGKSLYTQRRCKSKVLAGKACFPRGRRRLYRACFRRSGIIGTVLLAAESRRSCCLFQCDLYRCLSFTQ